MSGPARVAIIANSQTPYRRALHLRLAREIGQVEIYSIFTHEESNSPWQLDYPPEIRPVSFGQGEKSQDQSAVSSAWREWNKGGRIVDWIANHNIQLVLLFGYNDLGRIRILHWCAARSLPCYVFGDSNIHGDAKGIKALVKRAVVPWFLRKASGALCCGDYGRLYFERYGVPTGKIFYFPYEPDFDAIRREMIDLKQIALTRFGLPQGRRRFIYSGRLAPVKRVDLLLAAFADLADERPEWDLILAGDGGLRTELQASVRSSLVKRIYWLGFIDDSSHLNGLYGCSDVLILPSDYEPWGVVITEAAVGLGIVCSDVVGAGAHLVEEGVNGFRFPAGNLSALTDCLRRASSAGTVDVLKLASAQVLDKWRAKADPVQGLRSLLQREGLEPHV